MTRFNDTYICTAYELTGSGEKEDRSGCVTLSRHILHGFNHEFSDVRVDTVQIVLETTKAWFYLGITSWHHDIKIEDSIIVHYTYECSHQTVRLYHWS